jgi:hypothetical protein
MVMNIHGMARITDHSLIGKLGKGSECMVPIGHGNVGSLGGAVLRISRSQFIEERRQGEDTGKPYQTPESSYHASFAEYV